MRRAARHKLIVLALVLSGAALTAEGPKSQKRKDTERSQVLPLPPEPPKALLAQTENLDFHISPLLRTGGLSAQIRQSLNDLIRDTHGETIIKLRAFVAGAGDARRVQAETVTIFTEHKLPLPTLTILQIGALGQERAQVVIEAVVETRHALNQNGLAFFAGQTGSNLGAALNRLKQSAEEAAVAPEKILTTTCFTSRIENFDTSRLVMQSAFPNSAVNLLQAVRNPLTDASTCEAVGQLSQPPAGGPVVLFKDSRVTLVHSPQLIFTGLQLSFGSFLDDAHEAYVRLQQTASSFEPVDAPVTVNAFTLDAYAASALRKTASFPPSAFTVQMVEGLSAMDATGGVEAVLAPDVQAVVPVSR